MLAIYESLTIIDKSPALNIQVGTSSTRKGCSNAVAISLAPIM